MEEGKEVVDEQDLGAINIFLFSNGQQYSPPRKYYLKAEDLAGWDATLASLARSQYSPSHSTIELYTVDGCKIQSPADLKNHTVYVAVVPPDPFVQAGYDKYLLKASRSWEKRQSKRNSSGVDPMKPDKVRERPTAESRRGNSNVQTIDENIPLDVVMTNNVTLDETQRPSLLHSRHVSEIHRVYTGRQTEKRKVNQVSQRPNVPRRGSSPPIEINARKVSMSKRDSTPRSSVRLSRQSIPAKITTNKRANGTRAHSKQTLNGVTHKVCDRNPLYGLRSPVKKAAEKIEEAINEVQSSPDKTTINKADNDTKNTPTPIGDRVLIEKPRDNTLDTTIDTHTKAPDVAIKLKVKDTTMEIPSKIPTPLGNQALRDQLQDSTLNSFQSKAEDDKNKMSSKIPTAFSSQVLIEKPQDNAFGTTEMPYNAIDNQSEPINFLAGTVEKSLIASTKKSVIENDVIPIKIEREISNEKSSRIIPLKDNNRENIHIDIEQEVIEKPSQISSAREFDVTEVIMPETELLTLANLSPRKEDFKIANKPEVQEVLKFFNKSFDPNIEQEPETEIRDTCLPYINLTQCSTTEFNTTSSTAKAPNKIEKTFDNEPLNSYSVILSTPINDSKPEALSAISKYLSNIAQIFKNSQTTTSAVVEYGFQTENSPETNPLKNTVLCLENVVQKELSLTGAGSVNTEAVKPRKNRESNTDDMLMIPLILFKSTNDTDKTVHHDTDTTPLVVIVDKGDTVNLKLNIEIISAAGILKKSKIIDARKSRSRRNLSTDVNNNDAKLTHSKSLQSIENECTSREGCPKNQEIKAFQCMCCDRCTKKETDYNVDTNILRTDDQPCYVLLPIRTRPNREGSIRCPNIAKTSDKEVQKNTESALFSSVTVVTDAPKDHKVNVATSSQRVSLTSQTVKEDTYTEFTSNRKVFREAEENQRTEIVIVRTESSQTSPTDPDCFCGSKSSFRNTCCSQDHFTQTDWCDVMLEARTQPDGHYTFHLPPLQVLRDYDL